MKNFLLCLFLASSTLVQQTTEVTIIWKLKLLQKMCF